METKIDNSLVTVSWQQITSKIDQLYQLKNSPDSMGDMIAVANGLHSLLLRYSVEHNSGNTHSSKRVAVVMPSVFTVGKTATIKSQEVEVMEEEVKEWGEAEDFGTQSDMDKNSVQEEATVEAPVLDSVAKIQEMEVAPETVSSEKNEQPNVPVEAKGDTTLVEPSVSGPKVETPVAGPIPGNRPVESDTETGNRPVVDRRTSDAKPDRQYSIWEAYSSNEIPTLAQQKTQSSAVGYDYTTNAAKETPSYNNDVSPATAVKDLKKAISISDRYLFVNELFRGEEPTYERSIKTINNFNVYQEARYWIDRELKVKLGWDDKNPTVKQFDALVQRRFA